MNEQDIIFKHMEEMKEQGHLIAFLMDLRREHFMRGFAIGFVVAIIGVMIGAMLF